MQKWFNEHLSQISQPTELTHKCDTITNIHPSLRNAVDLFEYKNNTKSVFSYEARERFMFKARG